jgi:hypothetical protein
MNPRLRNALNDLEDRLSVSIKAARCAVSVGTPDSGIPVVLMSSGIDTSLLKNTVSAVLAEYAGDDATLSLLVADRAIVEAAIEKLAQCTSSGQSESRRLER